MNAWNPRIDADAYWAARDEEADAHFAEYGEDDDFNA